VHAEQLTDIEAKRMMLGIAETYQRLAKRAEGHQLSAGPSETQKSGQIGVRCAGHKLLEHSRFVKP
jgi:hypothetical protein